MARSAVKESFQMWNLIKRWVDQEGGYYLAVVFFVALIVFVLGGVFGNEDAWFYDPEAVKAFLVGIALALVPWVIGFCMAMININKSHKEAQFWTARRFFERWLRVHKSIEKVWSKAPNAVPRVQVQDFLNLLEESFALNPDFYTGWASTPVSQVIRLTHGKEFPGGQKLRFPEIHKIPPKLYVDVFYPSKSGAKTRRVVRVWPYHSSFSPHVEERLEKITP